MASPYGPATPVAARLVLILVLVVPTCLAQGNDTASNSTESNNSTESIFKATEFALNFFSDTAPIVALFGDQFAVQFLSESLSWVDHVIFAAVPIGIFTALTAAIRVQGPRWARTFVGRARENRAQAEIELMSSTSGEVCELFNGRGIVRATGKPRIAQIIVFPDLYDRSMKEGSRDKSCGIHTLQTAGSDDGDDGELGTSDGSGTIRSGKESIMEHQVHRGWLFRKQPIDRVSKVLTGFGLFMGLAHKLRRRSTKNFDPESPLVLDNVVAEPSLTATASNKTANKTAAAATTHVIGSAGGELHQGTDLPEATREHAGGMLRDNERLELPAKETPTASFQASPWPNMQLNLSRHGSRVRAVELIVAFVAAVCFQAGVIAVAVVVDMVKGMSERISGYERTSYGLPCFTAGSTAIFVGMATCAWAIDQSTVEHVWTRRDGTSPSAQASSSSSSRSNEESPTEESEHTDGAKKQLPRILWLQAGQTVSDQLFNPFVVLGGAKSFIMTSTRYEDAATAAQESANPGEKDGPACNDDGLQITGGEPANETVPYNRPFEKQPKKSPSNWKYQTVTMLGVFLASSGFILQIIGLRALPWPVSVAQLGSTLIMALIRGFVRRKLGSQPAFCPAAEKFEIDFLAINLAFSRYFRELRPGGRSTGKRAKWMREPLRNLVLHSSSGRHSGQLRRILPRRWVEWALRDSDGPDLRQAMPQLVCRWRVDTAPPRCNKKFLAWMPPSAGTATGGDQARGPKGTDTLSKIEKGKTPLDKESVVVSSEPVVHAGPAPGRSSQPQPPTVTPKPATSGASPQAKSQLVVSTSAGPASLRAGSTPADPVEDNKRPYFDDVPSQDLLKVRGRLGLLCGWQGEASKAAHALATSIEVFMNAFFPNGVTEDRLPFKWTVRAKKPSSKENIEADDDKFELSVRQQELPGPVTSAAADSQGRWESDFSELEAALSLWMARETLQAGEKAEKEAKPANSRRLEAELGTRHRFCRILGEDDEDGVLRRDLSWWVGENVAEESSARLDLGGGGRDPPVPAGGVAYAAAPPRTATRKGRSAARWDPCRDLLVIGFHGPALRSAAGAPVDDDDSDDAVRELAVFSSADLSTILAQHLFMSFVWAVAAALPPDCLHQGRPRGEQMDLITVEGGRQMDPRSFQHDWQLLSLRHRHLERAVRKMETAGLGSSTDILCCIVPALSFYDLLPNEVALHLIPSTDVKTLGWLETTNWHLQLVKEPVGARMNRHLAYVVAAKVVDYLCMAGHKLIYPDAVNSSLETLVKALGQRYGEIVEMLMPVYDLQGRSHEVRAVVMKYHGSDSFPSGLFDHGVEAGAAEAKAKASLNPNFLQRKLRFSPAHLTVLEMNKRSEDLDAIGTLAKELDWDKAHCDVFGWSALHYACSGTTEEMGDVVACVVDIIKHERLVWTDLVDYMGRSPIHIIAGRQDGFDPLKYILNLLGEDEYRKQTACAAPGPANLTPIHLAAGLGDEHVFERLRHHSAASKDSLDVWGRSPLHLACQGPGFGLALKLINQYGERSDLLQQDEFGETPISYLWQARERGMAAGLDKKRDDEGPSTKATEQSPCDEAIQKLTMLGGFYKPDALLNKRGQTALSLAAQYGDDWQVASILSDISMATFGNLRAAAFHIDMRDRLKWRALMFAIDRGRVGIITSLLDAGADPGAVDDYQEKGTHTPLAAVARRSGEWTSQAAAAILRSDSCKPEDVNFQDEYDWQTPLHLAVKHGNVAVVNRLLGDKRIALDLHNKQGWTPLVQAVADLHVPKKIALRLLHVTKSPRARVEAIMSVSTHYSVAVARLFPEVTTTIPNDQMRDEELDALIQLYERCGTADKVQQAALLACRAWKERRLSARHRVAAESGGGGPPSASSSG